MHKTCEDCKHCVKKNGANFCNVFSQILTSHMYCTNSFEPRPAPEPLSLDLKLYDKFIHELGQKLVEPVKDMVNHPAHYTQGGIECIEAIKAAVTGLVGIEAVCTGNIIRYIWRWKYKNGLEDLKKCRWYLDRLIKEVDHD